MKILRMFNMPNIACEIQRGLADLGTPYLWIFD